MKFIRLILILIICSMCSGSARAVSFDDSEFDWMKTTFDSITSAIPACLEVPAFSSMHQTSASLNVDRSGKWISTGVKLSNGKLLQLEWLTRGILPRPSKYKVLYRIDPRFADPQVFIQKYDYNQDKYISDFYHYKEGILLNYQNVPEMTFQDRIKDYTDYFKFNARLKIPVKKDDVINITLDQTGSYFGSKSEMNRELGSLDSLSVIYTQSPIPDNRIIYSNAGQFCSDGIKAISTEYASNCGIANLYWDLGINTKIMEGRIDNTAFNINKLNLLSCSESANGKDNNPLCYYDKGRGIRLSVGGTTIKDTAEKFVSSPYTGKDFFYHKSDVAGDLEFKTGWLIEGMVQGYNQFMRDWTATTDYAQFLTSFNDAKPDIFFNYLHFGRYLLDIEVGNSVTTVDAADLDAIEVEYMIMESGTPSDSTSGTSVERTFRGNAGTDGHLWVRVLSPNDNLTGTVQVKIANYSGSTWFSDLVYGQLVQPLRTKFNELSMMIYHKLISNASFQGIARTMLVLYIIIYGLVFLAGATQITVTDIVIRVLKIGVILALFSETSWTFFNQNLFNVFVEGTDSLLTSVVGITSRAGNVFGFIDPIFDKYTNERTWTLLLIQLLQIQSGLTFLALMTIYGILIYFRAVLEIIVSYCLAFLGLAVMVSLAPFFIVLILFERTKSMFDNWLSIMFSYMIQPTVLMVFFLLIDQIMTEHIASVVVRACWDILIPIKIGLDLNNLGIPLSFSFTLPFLPGIPFYVPQIAPITSITDFFSKDGTLSVVATSTLLFFALCKLASGSVDYVALVVQYLTNVIAARQDGKLQQGASPVNDIIGDMSSAVRPITSIPSKIGKFVKEKAIDQKISHRPVKTDSNVDYRNFVHNHEAPEASIAAVDKINIDANKRPGVSPSTASVGGAVAQADLKIGHLAPGASANSGNLSSESKNVSLDSVVIPEAHRPGAGAAATSEIKQPSGGAQGAIGKEDIAARDMVPSNSAASSDVSERRDSVVGSQNLELNKGEPEKSSNLANVNESENSASVESKIPNKMIYHPDDEQGAKESALVAERGDSVARSQNLDQVQPKEEQAQPGYDPDKKAMDKEEPDVEPQRENSAKLQGGKSSNE